MNQELKAIIEQLREENKLLKASIARLEATNRKLLEENQQLKERLGLNSTNSSLPPSRDLYRVKKQNTTPSLRNPGGQPGHRAHSYQAMTADEVIELIPTQCNCGAEVVIEGHFTREQKIEIPPIKPYVKEYRRYKGRCSRCGKKVIAPLPEGVGKDLLGPHAKAIIASFNGYFHNSKREVKQILEEIFHLPISLGLVSNTAKRVKEKLIKEYQQIEEAIKTSPYLHIDETGHKSKGKRGWAWIFTNKEVSMLKLTPCRGKQVLVDTLGKYEGYVISDRYGIYNHFKQEQRQICWSHLERDYERFAHSLHGGLSEQGARLVEIAKEVFSLNKALIREQIEASYFVRRINRLKKKLGAIFKQILRIRGIPQAHRVIRRIQKSFEMMWLFAKERAIAMTNNLAERQLRKYVIYRKKLLFTWSEWGNQFVERILSLYLSCRLKKTSAFAQLYQAISTHP